MKGKADWLIGMTVIGVENLCDAVEFLQEMKGGKAGEKSETGTMEDHADDVIFRLFRDKRTGECKESGRDRCSRGA